MNNIKKKHFLYLLPIPGFFSHTGRVGGHIAHAYGVVNGLVEFGFLADIVAEEPDFYLDNISNRYHVLPGNGRSPFRRIFWNQKFLSYVSTFATQPHGYSFSYCRYSVGFAPWIRRLKLNHAKLPLVLEVNSIGTPFKPWLRPFEKRALLSADLVICVSDVLRQQIVANLGQDIQDRIFLMPNAVASWRFAKPASDLPDVSALTTVKVGYAGALKPNYNLDVLTAAVRLVRASGHSVELHIAGDGPLRPTLEKSFFQAKWVVDHGRLDFTEVPAFLDEMNILVCPQSLKNHFMSPLKMYEYMAAHRPVIGARIPSVEALICHDESGLLYEPGDPNSLAAHITRLVTQPGLAQRLARTAQKEVQNKHTWSKRIESLLAELERRGLVFP